MDTKNISETEEDLLRIQSKDSLKENFLNSNLNVPKVKIYR